MLNSELQWLSALRRDTDLLVPEPVSTRDGEAIVSVRVEDVKEERVCILLRWVPGRSIDTGLSPTLFERVGLFMARLHQHAKYFVPPGDFIRPSWDWEAILGDETILDPDFAATHCDDLITGHEYRLFSEVAERAHDELNSVAINSGLLWPDPWKFSADKLSLLSRRHQCYRLWAV